MEGRPGQLSQFAVNPESSHGEFLLDQYSRTSFPVCTHHLVLKRTMCKANLDPNVKVCWLNHPFAGDLLAVLF